MTFQVPTDKNPMTVGELFKLMALSFFIFCEETMVK